MVDGGVDAPPPVKRKRGRPRKADVLAAQQAAQAAADGSITPAVNVNGVPPSGTNAVGAIAGLKPEPKPRKSRKKKGEVQAPLGVDMQLVGKTVTGVLDGSFDAGYLLSVRVQVGDAETVLRGVVFGPGLSVPILKSNDVAQGVKVVKRDETIPLPAASPISVLATPGSVPTPAFASQTAPPLATAASPYLHAAPTVTPKPLPTPAVVASADLNSQGNSTQGSVQTFPIATAVAQGTPAA